MTPDRGRVCGHCLKHDDCARCGEVEEVQSMTPVPGLGRICQVCIRSEVERINAERTNGVQAAA